MDWLRGKNPWLASLVGLLACQNAWALLQSCSVSTAPVSFGIYDPLSPLPNTATGTVTVNCTVTLIALWESWTIALSQGNSGNFNSRHMLNGSSVLSYNLYTSAAYTTVWGDGSGSTAEVSSPVTLLQTGNTSVNYPVYGVIPTGQDRAAGTFMDTITVTVNY
jgi:spore coat protein U-like protein